MKIFRHVRSAWSRRPWKGNDPGTPPDDVGDGHLALARQSLRALVEDTNIPPQVREALAEEFATVGGYLERLEQGHLHVAAFGRVGVGKSALLNALMGNTLFATSVLHGETRAARPHLWREIEAGGVFLVDTPGIDEIGGEERERMAHDVAARADLVLFVAEGDLTDTELAALRLLASEHRPMFLVLNKSDRYTDADRQLLLTTLARRVEGLIPPERILPVAALPAPQVMLVVAADGREEEIMKSRAPDVALLRQQLWDILVSEGKTLAALNAALFAGRLSGDLGARIVATRRALAEGLIQKYSLVKGVAVAFTPLPAVDILATAAADTSMLLHLGRLYGLPIAPAEAAKLLSLIAGQTILLMGTVWSVHAAASLLKGLSGGLSTLLTAGTQGSMAYLGTYVIGRVAERFFAQGRSFGPGGPGRVVEEILASLDRNSILEQARMEIRKKLKNLGGTAPKPPVFQ